MSILRSFGRVCYANVLLAALARRIICHRHPGVDRMSDSPISVSLPAMAVLRTRRAGMDFYVCLERKGFRVGRRRRCKSRIGAPHRISKEDAIKWFQQKFEGVVLEKHTETIY